MQGVLLGFAVYFIITTAQRYLTIPNSLWPVVTLALSIGVVVVEHFPWWYALSIAGISTLVNAAEALMLVAADGAILDLHRRNSPPRR